MAQRRERIATIVLIVLLASIPVVGGLQFHLLTKASEADVASMRRTTFNASRQVRNEISYELAGLISIVSTWSPDGRSASDVRDLYRAWEQQSRFPGLVNELVIYDHSDGRYLRYRTGDAGFTEVAADQIDWLAPVGSGGSMGTRDRFVLSVPIYLFMPEPTGGTRVSRFDRDDLDVLYLRLDVNYLVDVALPQLIAQYLGDDPDGFQAAVLDADAQKILYSTSAVTASDFVAGPAGAPRFVPDEAWPLVFWSGGDDSAFPRPAGIGTSLPDGATGGDFQFQNPVVRQWLALREWTQNPPDAPSAENHPSGPRIPDSGFVLLIWHAAGSIREAALSERNQNFLYSCIVLGLFGAVATVFQVLFVRAHRLRMKEQEFVASVTHELRTPVSAMHAAAENLAEGIVRSEDRVREYGAAMLAQSKRLRAMIDQTLLYSGLHGSRRPRKRSVRVDEFAKRILEQLPDVEIERLGVTVKRGMPLYRGDAIALESIITNLITNAFKHNPGDTRVDVSLSSEVTRKGSWLVIEVRDSGLGIPRAELAHVREPFFRGAATQERQVPGTGLGLNIVQRIVTIGGGKLDIESSEGQGTTVCVRLPFEIADEQ